jgi:hypothetical protein
MEAWSPSLGGGYLHAFQVWRLLEADRADRAGQLKGGRWFGTVRGVRGSIGRMVIGWLVGSAH